jgi:hypothetical protein
MSRRDAYDKGRAGGGGMKMGNGSWQLGVGEMLPQANAER